MNRSSLGMLVFAGALALATASCGGSAPAGPSPNLKTETFTGTLGIGGSVVHPFTVGAAGTITVGLASLTGPNSIGLGIGGWDGRTCTLSNGATTSAAVYGTVLGLDVTAPVNMCVSLFDRGTIGTSASYSVDVIHP